MDEKQKEELKAKSKKTAKIVGKGLINGIEKLTTWSIEKTKEGYVKYQKYTEEQAALKRQEEERQKKIAEEKRIREEAEAKILRNERHKELIETLSDDFNVLKHDLGVTFKFINTDSVGSIINDAFLNANLKNPIHEMAINSNKEDMTKIFAIDAGHIVNRTVVDFSEQEKGILKLYSLFNFLELISDEEYDKVQLSLAYNSGSSSIKRTAVTDKHDDKLNFTLKQVIDHYLKTYVEKPKITVNEAIGIIGEVRKGVDDPKLLKTINKELKNAEGWLKPSDL